MLYGWMDWSSTTGIRKCFRILIKGFLWKMYFEYRDAMLFNSALEAECSIQSRTLRVWWHSILLAELATRILDNQKIDYIVDQGTELNKSLNIPKYLEPHELPTLVTVDKTWHKWLHNINISCKCWNRSIDLWNTVCNNFWGGRSFSDFIWSL